jgi:hypothetical protein
MLCTSRHIHANLSHKLEFIARSCHPRWSPRWFLTPEDSHRRVLPPGHDWTSFCWSWPRRPMPSSLHPHAATTKSLNKARKGVPRVLLDILYAIYYPNDIGDHRNIDISSRRRRGHVSGNIPATNPVSCSYLRPLALRSWSNSQN